jgi:hypothetical protein
VNYPFNRVVAINENEFNRLTPLVTGEIASVGVLTNWDWYRLNSFVRMERPELSSLTIGRQMWLQPRGRKVLYNLYAEANRTGAPLWPLNQALPTPKKANDDVDLDEDTDHNLSEVEFEADALPAEVTERTYDPSLHPTSGSLDKYYLVDSDKRGRQLELILQLNKLLKLEHSCAKEFIIVASELEKIEYRVTKLESKILRAFDSRDVEEPKIFGLLSLAYEEWNGCNVNMDTDNGDILIQHDQSELWAMVRRDGDWTKSEEKGGEKGENGESKD